MVASLSLRELVNKLNFIFFERIFSFESSLFKLDQIDLEIVISDVEVIRILNEPNTTTFI